MSKWLNTVEAADLAGVSVQTILRAAREDRLTRHGARDRFLFEEAEVLRFAKVRAARPESKRGRTRPMETNVLTSCSAPKRVADWLRSRAAEQGETLSNVMLDIIKREYEKEVR